MQRAFASYVTAALMVATIAWLTAALLPLLGLASSALLFLLPVLFASARSGIGPGLFAAIAGAAAYNYFLLPPRLTWRIHGFDNVISVVVLVAVALVTSRLATQLRRREAEALARAEASREAASLSALLGAPDLIEGLQKGLAYMAERYGAQRLVNADEGNAETRDFSALDQSAAAWALHNGDMTGHGTTIMAAAEWTYLPLAPHNRGAGGLLAVARPESGGTRGDSELAHLQQLAYLIGQARDRVALESERRARERLEDSEELRRALLASLAHDFRTPLTVITGRLEEIADREPDAHEALAAARRLDRTMEDLLGTARLDSGLVAPSHESLDLVDVVGASATAILLPEGVLLHRSIPPDLPFVQADPVLLHHVLVNLLDNAARYAEAGVWITAYRSAAHVALSVHDDGPGIAKADRTRIFERFTRLGGSDRMKGSGLGLSIVKRFADAMEIPLTVSNTATGGACFTLELSCTGERE